MDVLLADEQIQGLIENYSRDTVMEAVRTQTDRLRAFIGTCTDEGEAFGKINALKDDVARAVKSLHTPNMRKVINGTGTVLHTNLGRAPICEEHMKKAAELVTGYSNLEYNLEEGKRGERYSHFEELLCRLTGAEAAMAVNNNAAAVMLILSSLAKGGEVIVSRGELVEIGGKFRIPDVNGTKRGVSCRGGKQQTRRTTATMKKLVTEETKALLKSSYKQLPDCGIYGFCHYGK
mgnify:CR=1 FL=1